jgi:hypothetical protein
MASPAAATWIFMSNMTGPAATRLRSSSNRKSFGSACNSSAVRPFRPAAGSKRQRTKLACPCALLALKALTPQ